MLLDPKQDSFDKFMQSKYAEEYEFAAMPRTDRSFGAYLGAQHRYFERAINPDGNPNFIFLDNQHTEGTRKVLHAINQSFRLFKQAPSAKKQKID